MTCRRMNKYDKELEKARNAAWDASAAAWDARSVSTEELEYQINRVLEALE